MKYIVILFYIFIKTCLNQQTIILKGNNQVDIYKNNQYNEDFIAEGSIYSCQTNNIYSYIQTHQQFVQNSPYTVQIYGLTQPIDVKIKSDFQFINPQLNTTSCNQTDCIVQIKNGCPMPNYFNYFDVIQLTIGQLDNFSYNVICDASQRVNSFEWGIIVCIILSIIVISLTATCSNAWSIKNYGISINYWLILGLDVFIITLGTLIFLQLILNQIDIFLIILTWIYGIITIALCSVECLYLLKIGCLKRFFKLCCKGYKLRVMDIIGLALGVGICCGWYFSNNNWILSDFITIFMWIGTIKLFKFTSLKMAVFSFFFTIIIQIIFIIVMQIILGLSYNSQVINNFNNPFFLQIPTINPVPNQKCSWLFISSLVYPGITLSYLYRFDKCRSSYVYFTIFIVGYFIGSIIWTLISLFSPFTLPFGIISEPILLITIILYSNRRNQLPILWSGQFLDQQYKDNKQKVTELVQLIKIQKTQSKISFSQSLIRGLRIGSDITQLTNRQ